MTIYWRITSMGNKTFLRYIECFIDKIDKIYIRYISDTWYNWYKVYILATTIIPCTNYSTWELLN